MVPHDPFRGGNELRARVTALSRRSWLATAFLGLTGATASSRPVWSKQTKGGDKDGDSDAKEIALVQYIAKKAGLERFSDSRTPHFLGLGDADARFRNDALKRCESLVPVFIQHFNSKGFKLAMPKNRLTVITLKSAGSYQAFIGENPGANVGGHYDLDTNRLVMFDFRPADEGPAVVNDPTRINLLTLVHETTHLLCFNTGLLSREASVPDWVSEGLATYVEQWRNKQTRIGEPNVGWLSFLKDSRNKGTSWIPITNLVADDKTFDDKTVELSYAESWLAVHYLMKSPPQKLAKFQAYLAGLSSAEATANRVAYAEKHLGSLKDLEREIERHYKRGAR
jgi:Protein of unknown function (DUF1570)